MSEAFVCLGLSEVIRHRPIIRDSDGKPLVGPDGAPQRGAEQEYHLAPPDTLEVVARWERWLEDCAFDALNKQRRRWTPEQFEKKELALVEKIAAGEYAWDGAFSWSIISNPFNRKGYRAWIGLRLKVLDPHLTDAFVDELAEEEAEAIKRLALRLQKGDDPNVAEPGAASASG
jgi:hypothetical protein